MIVLIFVPESSSPLSKTMRLCCGLVEFDGELDVKGTQVIRDGASDADGLPDTMNEVQKPIASWESLASLCIQSLANLNDSELMVYSLH